MELRWEYMYFWNNVCIFVFFLVSNFPIFGDSINHPCFCHVSTATTSRSSSSPGTVYSPAAMARVFINPGISRGYWSQKKGYKSKYHRDMGYGVKMRIYVFLEQCMHLCIFPGFQLSHLWGFYKSSLFLSCFHPQRHSRSSASPGTVVLSCAMARVFINPGAIEAKKRAIKASIIGIWDMGLRWEYMYFWNNVCICVFFLVSDFPIFGDSINHPCVFVMFPPATTLQVLLLSWYSGTLLPRWPEFFINPGYPGAIEAKKRAIKASIIGIWDMGG